MALDIFIPDIHGDVESLKKTLLAAHLARVKHGKLVFEDPGLHELVFAGDYIDRGETNFATLELLIAVREHFKRVVLEPGNHEIAALQALTHPEQPRWMKEWLEGLPVLKEVAEREHLKRLSHATKDAHPLANFELPKDDPNTGNYLKAWAKLIESNPDWQTIDFPEAYGRTRDLFLNNEQSPFRVLFSQLQFAHRIGAILSVHAGMNEKGWQIGVEGLQKLYQHAWHRRDFRFLHDFNYTTWTSNPHASLSDLTCMVKPLPPRREPLISEKTASMLHRDGIRVLMHGHAVLLGKGIAHPGVQQCNDAYGIADMNGDIGMSSGFLTRDPKKPSDCGFIQYDEKSGQFTAYNPKTGLLDFGKLIDGEYTFPKIDSPELIA